MFTVKLMKGMQNEQIKVIEAREVEIRMSACGSSDDGIQHAVIVKPGHDGNEDFWHYVGGPDWDTAIIENAAGKTTEIIRAPNRAGFVPAAVRVA
jgi:hypothetical protein